MNKYKGVTEQDVLQEMERRKQAKGFQGLNLGGQPDVGEALVNASRTKAGLGPMAQKTSQVDDLVKMILGEKVKQQMQDPLDVEMKQGRIKALNAGLSTDAEGNIIKTSDIARDDREGRLREFEARRQASSLRGELTQNPYIKRFQEMNSAATGIDSILSDTLSRTDNQSKNVGDQAVITLYNKILDPLSVVRESEYARTPEGQSLLNRIAGFAQKVEAGGSGLTDSDRIEIARAAKVLINNAGEMYNSKLGDYENLATGYGVPDVGLVTGGYQRFSPYDIDKKYGQSPVVPGQQQVTPQIQGQLTPDQQMKRERLRKKYGK